MENVSKNFGGLEVLKDINLHIDAEEIVGLIGPNGAGKSTTFNIITSFYQPNQGEVYLNGRNITHLPPHRICRRGISRTFQLVKTFLKMTVFENTSWWGRSTAASTACAMPAKMRMEALELVGLADKKDILTATSPFPTAACWRSPWPLPPCRLSLCWTNPWPD